MIRVGVVILFKVGIHIYTYAYERGRCLSTEDKARLTDGSGCLGPFICLGRLIKQQQQQLPCCAVEWGRFNGWSLQAAQLMALRDKGRQAMFLGEEKARK